MIRAALKRLFACASPPPEEVGFFRRGFAYPSEMVNGRWTPYAEVQGVVASVNAFAPKDPLEDVRIRMNVPGHGEVVAYARAGLRVRGGDRVLVHVYDAGGGWYPDNRVVAVEHREGERHYPSLPTTLGGLLGMEPRALLQLHDAAFSVVKEELGRTPSLVAVTPRGNSGSFYWVVEWTDDAMGTCSTKIPAATRLGTVLDVLRRDVRRQVSNFRQAQDKEDGDGS